MHDAAGEIAILGAPALGDGLLALVLARNLERAGRAATVYHDALVPLRAWFPWARIAPLPEAAALVALLTAGPAFVGDRALLPPVAPAALPDVHVFTKAHWDRRRPYLRSLQAFAERAFDLAWRDDGCGLVAPGANVPRPQPRRVVLHPYSARSAKDWPEARWVELAGLLRAAGFEPVVLLAPGEGARWRAAAGDACAPEVPGPLDAVAAWLADAGAVVACDSGIGHLASALGRPVLSLFRKRSAARFWAPCWSRVAVVTAPWRLPGGGGHRHWGRLLSARRVARAFLGLVGAPPGP